MRRREDLEETHGIDWRVPAVVGRLPSGWTVTYRVMAQDGNVVVSGMTVEPTGEVPYGGMTTGLMRDLYPAAALRLVQDQLKRYLTPGTDEWQAEQNALRLLEITGGPGTVERMARERAVTWGSSWAEVLDRLAP